MNKFVIQLKTTFSKYVIFQLLFRLGWGGRCCQNTLPARWRNALQLHLEYNAEFDLCYFDTNLLDFQGNGSPGNPNKHVQNFPRTRETLELFSYRLLLS